MRELVFIWEGPFEISDVLKGEHISSPYHRRVASWRGGSRGPRPRNVDDFGLYVITRKGFFSEKIQYIGLTYRENFEERLKAHLRNKRWLHDDLSAYQIRLGYHTKESNERTTLAKIADAEAALIDVLWDSGLRNKKRERPNSEKYLKNLGKNGPLPSELYDNPFTGEKKAI